MQGCILCSLRTSHQCGEWVGQNKVTVKEPSIVHTCASYLLVAKTEEAESREGKVPAGMRLQPLVFSRSSAVSLAGMFLNLLEEKLALVHILPRNIYP